MDSVDCEAMKAAQRAKRNLSPHAEALAAMWIWHNEYGRSACGSMDFYDRLTPGQKASAKQCVEEILAAVRAKS